MIQLAALAALACGVLVAHLADLERLAGSTWYAPVTSALLAVGLYAAAAGIDVGAARRQLRTILAVVTVGVVGKALVVGALLVAITGDTRFLLYAVALAQIDPLAVASIGAQPHISPATHSLLRAWASFDDPVTVVLVTFVAALLVGGLAGAVSAGVAAAIITVGKNAVFLAVALLGWRWLRRWQPAAMTWVLLLLVGAVTTGAMLGLAVAALVVRPARIVALADPAVRWVLLAAAGLIGAVAAAGVSIAAGVGLGVAMFGAQALAGLIAGRRLPAVDRTYLALAQQNGVTAIVLALSLQSVLPTAVAIIVPAVVTINVAYAVSNWVLRRRIVAPIATLASEEAR